MLEFEIKEKKVLDIIDALLISSYDKQDEEIAEANEIYSQIQPGMNKPNMCHGPNAKFETIWNSLIYNWGKISTKY